VGVVSAAAAAEAVGVADVEAAVDKFSVIMRFSVGSMKHHFQSGARRLKRLALGTASYLIAFAFALLALGASPPRPAKTFSTPQDAVIALVAATTAKDNNALHELFGAAGADLENPDRVQSTNELSTFTAAFNQAHRLERKSDSQYILAVGTDAWPFPVPIVKKNEGWMFDTEAGKQELLNRRIGKNELSALEVMRAYVDAQRDYASRDRDGDSVLEYAQRIASSPGRMDGLYWPAETSSEISPLGPWVAEAQIEGYFSPSTAEDEGPQPFHGYYFKILTQQGIHAPGGKHDYIINGNMIGGFALIGWPAEYGDSGLMTFIVNQQGRVYQKDLGKNTAKIVKKIREYDPDSSWQISPD